MGEAEVTLTSRGLPGLFHAADQASIEGQRRHLRLTAARLSLAVAAAMAGAVTVTLRGGSVNLAAFVSAGCFVAALALEIVLLHDAPEKLWYDGRAIAESVKTLAWRYVAGGTPFGIQLSRRKADELLLRRFEELLRLLPSEGLRPELAPPITPQMRLLREAPLGKRQEAYLRERILDQQRWYAARASRHRRSARRWQFALAAVEVAGVAAAIARAFGAVHWDLAGIAAAMVGAGAAWLAVKQHGANASAYSLALHELALVRGKLEEVTSEREWASAVSDAEEAISREHTTWRASRSA
jgi:hypothetical protein